MALLDKLTSGSSSSPDNSGMSKQAKLVNWSQISIVTTFLHRLEITIVPKATLIKHINIRIILPAN